MSEESSSSGPPQRRRLVLAPRTKDPAARAASAAAASKSTRKSSIFGSAKPREEILKAKGVDYKQVDADLDARTAGLPRMSEAQSEEYKALESEAAFAAAELESAGVDATGEAKEALVAAVAAKKAEMKAFLDAIRKEGMVSTNGERPRFERPSERRARQEAAGRDRGGSGDYGRGDDGNYGNFGGRDRNRGGGDYGNNYGGSNNRSSGGNRHESRPGDWTCSQCQANVFASKSECYRCGNPKGDSGGGGYNNSYDNRDRNNSYGSGGGYNNSKDRNGGGRQKYDHIDRMLEGDDTVGEAW